MMQKMIFFNQCDKWRDECPKGNQNSHEMLFNKMQISKGHFETIVDASSFLGDGQTLESFVASDPDHGFFKSTVKGHSVLFIRKNDMEYIFTPGGENPENLKVMKQDFSYAMGG